MTPEDQEQLRSIVREETAAVEQRLTTRIEQVETALLTEFHKWASPLEMRVRSHAAALRALDAEQEFQADRLSKLEGKSPDAPQ
jgi:hypothetical protein